MKLKPDENRDRHRLEAAKVAQLQIAEHHARFQPNEFQSGREFARHDSAAKMDQIRRSGRWF